MADTNLQIVASLVDNASSALQQMGGNMQNTAKSLDSVKKSADDVRNTFGLMSVAILAPIGLMVNAASEQDSALELLTVTLQNEKDAAIASGNADSTVADQKKRLTDQIEANQAKITKLTSEVDRGKISWADYTSQVDKLNQTDDKLQQQLDTINGRMAAVSMNVEQTVKSFTGLAEKNVDLGFTMTDTYNALTAFSQAGLTTQQSTQALSTAMDLAVGKHMELGAAATAVSKIYNGQMSMALKSVGITAKDNLTQMEALEILNQRFGGDAKKMSQDLDRQMKIAAAETNELSVTFGNTLVPALTNVLKALEPVLQTINDLAKAHPNLTAGIMGTLAAVGLLAGAIAGVAQIVSSFISLLKIGSMVVGAFGTALDFLAANPIILIIAAIVAVIAIIVLMVTHWQQVKDTVVKVWTDVQNFLKPAFEWLSGAWNTLWQNMSDFFTAIWGGIKQTFDNIINGIKSGFQNLISFVSNLIQPLMNVANSIGSVVSSATKGVSSGLSSALGALTSIHLASGGIVNSPTLALIGEAGPEAVVPLSGGGGYGGGGGVTIIINGGQFTDPNSTRKLFNQMAREINKSNKLRTY